MSIRVEGQNSTLTGPVPDQPALYGIVNRLRDLGMELISIERIEAGQN